ncbi:hypothetical protein GCM10010168_63420 [Actinoplanes ianthinogenes]|uniref:HTH araC/xylS-type domain-containing protein n=1 Tax=Actinoplanes ianthinogenes TaxID=122358 RepID=A0ABM7LJH4_9ACTN|nr:AraC family transcriptional regulator [Actinoplanes ianthinogenes]BCJ39410.1 hypothetical protein Aiant_00670 [Actinoplanes ianthinogenes]GGR36314.1 hypothetical protein GCM10010168_63420 [Actinoplanes ianthinogenes]
MIVVSDPRRVEVRTRDRDVAVTAVNQVIPHEARVAVTAGHDVDLTFRAVSYGALSALRIRLAGVHYAGSGPIMPTLLAGVVTEGRSIARTPQGELVCGPQDGVVYPEGLPFGADHHHTAQQFLTVPAALAAELAEAPGLRFQFGGPVSEAKRKFWARTVAFLSGELTASDVVHPPLVVEQFLRQAVAAMVTVFPNTTMTAAYVPGPGRAEPAVVRRAVEFMETHADQPLTVTRIATVAGTGPRSLQEAFRRHLGSTPLSHLRRIRLDRAHQELLAGGDTVERIARRWGFADPGRFAGYYRAAYGRTPGRTLRCREVT